MYITKIENFIFQLVSPLFKFERPWRICFNDLSPQKLSSLREISCFFLTERIDPRDYVNQSEQMTNRIYILVEKISGWLSP